MRLLNFKGIRDFTFTPNGQDASVLGDNATGKTTIEDSFLWLLFGKDSQGKADFALKTLDANNNAIPMIDHEVEGVFDIGGRMMTLKKVYAEIWTKKRGSANKVFSGHEVNHFVDGVPCQKKEYDACIAGIAPEETFKLLTSPAYFNEQLHWTERRKILLAVCGDISDSEVIASDRKLAKLPDILQGRKLEDHKKVIAARRAEINKELDKIPTRIDEATRAMPALPTRSAEELSLLKASYTNKKEEKQQEQARIISGGEIAEKKRKMAEVQGEIIRLRVDSRSAQDVVIAEKRKALNEISVKVDALERNISWNKKVASEYKREIEALEAKRESLRNEWHDVNSKEFGFTQDSSCPTCGQSLPEEQLVTARESALASFNMAKATQLEAISAQGKNIKAKIDATTHDLDVLEKEIPEKEAELAQLMAESAKITEEIKSMQEQSTPIIGSPAYTQKLREEEQLESEIQQLNTGNAEALERVRNQIIDLDIVLREINDDLDKIRRRKDGLARVAELEAEEKKLAAEFEKLEGELNLCDQFTKIKVALMDEKINSRFKFARFKMFKENINGGIEDCCETIYKGVPYGGGLNAGHRIIVGMDIIRTFSEYYNFEAPIFVDNAESVTTLPEMNAQVIRLVKPEITEENRHKYSKLVIETESKNEYREAV